MNTVVFRTQPLLGDQWSRELRNYSLCCSARFSAINIACYRHLSPVLLHVTKFRATVNAYRLVATVSARFTFRASTFASAKVTAECISEVPVSDFVPETGDPKIEGFHGFSQSRDALFIVFSNSVFITILGYKGTKHTCRQPQSTNCIRTLSCVHTHEISTQHFHV